jgi:hypothetical protein
MWDAPQARLERKMAFSKDITRGTRRSDGIRGTRRSNWVVPKRHGKWKVLPTSKEDDWANSSQTGMPELHTRCTA